MVQRVKYFLLCQAVQHNPLPCLLGVFDGLTSNIYPCPMPPLYMVAAVEFDGFDVGKEETVWFYVLDPNGRDFIRAECTHRVQAPFTPNHSPGGFLTVPLVDPNTRAQLVIPEPGAYRVEMRQHDKVLGSVDVAFSLATQG